MDLLQQLASAESMTRFMSLLFANSRPQREETAQQQQHQQLQQFPLAAPQRSDTHYQQFPVSDYHRNQCQIKISSNKFTEQYDRYAKPLSICNQLKQAPSHTAVCGTQFPVQLARSPHSSERFPTAASVVVVVMPSSDKRRTSQEMNQHNLIDSTTNIFPLKLAQQQMESGKFPFTNAKIPSIPAISVPPVSRFDSAAWADVSYSKLKKAPPQVEENVAMSLSAPLKFPPLIVGQYASVKSKFQSFPIAMTIDEYTILAFNGNVADVVPSVGSERRKSGNSKFINERHGRRAEFQVQADERALNAHATNNNNSNNSCGSIVSNSDRTHTTMSGESDVGEMAWAKYEGTAECTLKLSANEMSEMIITDNIHKTRPDDHHHASSLLVCSEVRDPSSLAVVNVHVERNESPRNVHTLATTFSHHQAHQPHYQTHHHQHQHNIREASPSASVCRETNCETIVINATDLIQFNANYTDEMTIIKQTGASGRASGDDSNLIIDLIDSDDKVNMKIDMHSSSTKSSKPIKLPTVNSPRYSAAAYVPNIRNTVTTTMPTSTLMPSPISMARDLARRDHRAVPIERIGETRASKVETRTLPVDSLSSSPAPSPLSPSSSSCSAVLPARTRLRRQRQMRSLDANGQQEDPIERLNRLRAKISGALSEVKGVLKQYSVDDENDQAAESQAGTSKVTARDDKQPQTTTATATATATPTTSTTTPSEGPLHFRFVRKVRRRSVFDESDQQNDDSQPPVTETNPALVVAPAVLAASIASPSPSASASPNRTSSVLQEPIAEEPSDLIATPRVDSQLDNVTAERSEVQGAEKCPSEAAVARQEHKESDATDGVATATAKPKAPRKTPRRASIAVVDELQTQTGAKRNRNAIVSQRRPSDSEAVLKQKAALANEAGSGVSAEGKRMRIVKVRRASNRKSSIDGAAANEIGQTSNAISSIESQANAMGKDAMGGQAMPAIATASKQSQSIATMSPSALASTPDTTETATAVPTHSVINDADASLPALATTAIREQVDVLVACMGSPLLATDTFGRFDAISGKIDSIADAASTSLITVTTDQLDSVPVCESPLENAQLAISTTASAPSAAISHQPLPSPSPSTTSALSPAQLQRERTTEATSANTTDNAPPPLPLSNEQRVKEPITHTEAIDRQKQHQRQPSPPPPPPPPLELSRDEQRTKDNRRDSKIVDETLVLADDSHRSSVNAACTADAIKVGASEQSVCSEALASEPIVSLLPIVKETSSAEKMPELQAVPTPVKCMPKDECAKKKVTLKKIIRKNSVEKADASKSSDKSDKSQKANKLEKEDNKLHKSSKSGAIVPKANSKMPPIDATTAQLLPMEAEEAVKAVEAEEAEGCCTTLTVPAAAAEPQEEASEASEANIAEPIVVVKPKKPRKIKKKVIIKRQQRKLSVGDAFFSEANDSASKTTSGDVETIEKAIAYVTDDEDDDDDHGDNGADNNMNESDQQHHSELIEAKPLKSCLKERVFHVGEAILYAERFKKTQVRWKKGQIIDRITSISYKLDIDGKEVPAHISYIKRYNDRKVAFSGKEYLEIDYEQIAQEEQKARSYSIWNMV